MLSCCLLLTRKLQGLLLQKKNKQQPPNKTQNQTKEESSFCLTPSEIQPWVLLAIPTCRQALLRSVRQEKEGYVANRCRHPLRGKQAHWHLQSGFRLFWIASPDNGRTQNSSKGHSMARKKFEKAPAHKFHRAPYHHFYFRLWIHLRNSLVLWFKQCRKSICTLLSSWEIFLGLSWLSETLKVTKPNC